MEFSNNGYQGGAPARGGFSGGGGRGTCYNCTEHLFPFSGFSEGD